MEEDVRRELLELCDRIINDEDNLDVENHLTSVQLLYEKLLVINYLKQKKASSSSEEAKEKALADIEKEEPKKSELRVEKRPTESPISIKKMVKDETPAAADRPAEQEKREKPQMEAASLPPQSSVNERYSAKPISLGLNDRIAFTSQLFEGNQEDLNRVISQINTFENLNEAEKFIDEMVKPDYDWAEKEEFEERFRELVRARFGEV